MREMQTAGTTPNTVNLTLPRDRSLDLEGQ